MVSAVFAKTVLIMTDIALGMSFILKEKNQELRVNPADVHVIRSVTGRTWDFSACAPGCKLMLGRKIMNKRNLVLNTLDAMELAPLLHNGTLPDRMYVWGKTATMALREQHSNRNEFEVEHLDRFEGDMILQRDTVDLIFSAEEEGKPGNGNTTTNNSRGFNHRSKRGLYHGRSIYWEGEIPWQFQANAFSPEEKAKITEAITFLHENTCVRFREDASLAVGQPRINFVRGLGCYSHLGKKSDGQTLALGPGCFYLGLILHQVAHALGLYHENNRPDRDLYIQINHTNILPDEEYFFRRWNWTSLTYTYGIPYDYSSAMHASQWYFSRSILRQPTIIARDHTMQEVMGQGATMSFLDVKFINVLYNCSVHCRKTSLEWSYCRNGGYRDPNNCNLCKCPSGFVPPSCSSIAPGVNADCGRTDLPATEDESFLTSPGYPTGYPGNADCAWLIMTAPGTRTRLEFTGSFEIPSIFGCETFVEVRFKDITRAGARYCNSDTPSDILYSHGDAVLILLHTSTKGYTGFNMTYQAEKCGGCSQDSGTSEPVCFRSELYDCSAEVKVDCRNTTCLEERENTCFRESSYCCPGYHGYGDVCKKHVDSAPTEFYQ